MTTVEKPKLWVALYDLHYPVHCPETLACVLEFVRKNTVDGVILGGDQLDNAEISHHNRDRAKFKPQGSFKANERGFNSEVLVPIERAIGGYTKKIWLEGNHDFWEKQMDEISPELEGCFSRRANLNLDDRGWRFIDNGKTYHLGKLKVIHGDQLFGSFGGGTMPSRKAVDTYMSNVLMGHTHAPQSCAKISPVEDDQKLMAWVAPCMCKMNPDYIRNRPTAWVNGFIIIEVFRDGSFNLYPVIITRGRCSYGGQVYGRR